MSQQASEFAPTVIPDEEDGGFIATPGIIKGVVEQGETREEALENLCAALAFTLWAETKEGRWGEL